MMEVDGQINILIDTDGWEDPYFLGGHPHRHLHTYAHAQTSWKDLGMDTEYAGPEGGDA